MNHALISDEKPGEFDGVPDKLVALIRLSRREKAAWHQLERDRVSATAEPESAGKTATLARIDSAIAELRASRVRLLYDIAFEQPGFAIAMYWAIMMDGYDPRTVTVRYNKRRRGTFSFKGPERPVVIEYLVNSNQFIMVRDSLLGGAGYTGKMSEWVEQ